jgi:DNA-directed RNA polymerase subunit K/omega
MMAPVASSGGEEDELFQAIGFRSSVEKHLLADLEKKANQGRPAAEQGERLNEEVAMSEDIGKGESYVPVQRDARVDAIERQLKEADWSPVVKMALLAFTRRAVDLSPIIRSQEPAAVSKLGEILSQTTELLTDEVERRAVIHLRETVNTLETLTFSQAVLLGAEEYGRQERIVIARRALDLAERASQAVDQEHNRTTLSLVCALLETELGFADKMIEQSDSNIAE